MDSVSAIIRNGIFVQADDVHRFEKGKKTGYSENSSLTAESTQAKEQQKASDHLKQKSRHPRHVPIRRAAN